ncbi:MAG TPA: HAD family phosphatase, partial [Arthrobacter bacterium]|nr:HAD family phosphatase [Arthrobacter sp.]HCB56740.1 HAD family phosphatase [Arthrobacter sp.]
DLEAVLWDMDGTLVDTDPFWMSPQQALALDHGLKWTNDDAPSTVGPAMFLGCRVRNR